jgi:hypothetical protein
MLQHVSILTVGHLQRVRKFFLARVAYVSTYVAESLHKFKINIVKIKCYISLKIKVLWLKYRSIQLKFSAKLFLFAVDKIVVPNTFFSVILQIK